MKQTFYSNGKLLITGEYVVLEGAKALALPTKFGQNLIVEESGNEQIAWKSYDSDSNIWFEDTIDFKSIRNKEQFSEAQTTKNILIEILHEAFMLNPEFLENSKGYTISTYLTFPRNWGLGTSSTLINNIAQWAKVDAFKLLKNSFGGSGYDIANAQNNFPIIYWLEEGNPKIEKADFKPKFSEHIFFVYLNKKQNSKSAIASYKEKKASISETVSLVNNLTSEITATTNLVQFQNLVEKHEALISTILDMPTVKEKYFKDFNGSIKSLGAWGGDFVMVASEENPSTYFKEKGFEVILSYREMIL